MQSMQNKIDKLISNANYEFTNNKNVVCALVDYNRALDLFDFLDKKYTVQIHDINVRIAVCYDILGNFNKTLEFLNKSMSLVENISCLVLYKAVLLQTLGKQDESQNLLLYYKKICNKQDFYLFELFRLIFLYIMQVDNQVLLKEINNYLQRYKKNAIILYLRSTIYYKISNTVQNKFEYIKKQENDIKEARLLDPDDTELLIKDGINNENLTKLFFLIVPEMDNYQPKALVNYSTFKSGFKILYTVFKAIKLLRIKVEKKRLKSFYNNKLQTFKLKNDSSSESINNCSSNYYSNNSNNSILHHNHSEVYSNSESSKFIH